MPVRSEVMHDTNSVTISHKWFVVGANGFTVLLGALVAWRQTQVLNLKTSNRGWF